MRTIKWAFFGYLALCAVLVIGIGVSFAVTRSRDPATGYGTYGGNLKSLDPAVIGDTGTSELAGYVYECLYNYAYAVEPYKLEPELADGQPEVSSDGLEWTIRLKPGIHFYDPSLRIFPDGKGPELTAEDVVYSWKRVCNFHNGVTANYAQVFQGRLIGIDDWFAYTKSCSKPSDIDWSRPVEGLAAVDRHTVRIRLTQPFPQLHYNLTMMCTAIVNRQAAEYLDARIKGTMIGTGPYAMAEHLPDQRIVFEANPLYRGGADVQSGTAVAEDKRLPQVKRVQLTAFAEPLPPWYLFLQGQLDASGVPKDTFGQAIAVGTGDLSPAMQANGIKLTKRSDPTVAYIGFNMADPVVGKNKPLRQAMSLAFDRKRYIDLYLNGRGIAANGPIPPGFPSYDGSRVAPYCRFDLDAAREKMREAERINGGPFKTPLHILYGNTATGTTQMADFIATSMRQIGLTVVSDFKPYGTFLQMLDRKQAQIYSLGWVADYPDEQNFWQLFYGRNAGPGGLNATNFVHPEFDALFEKTATEPPGPTRDAEYARMQDIVLEECPWLLLNYATTYQLFHDWKSEPKGTIYGHGYGMYSRIDFGARRKWLAKNG